MKAAKNLPMNSQILEPLKIDRRKLKTIANYAADEKKDRKTIYNWIKEKKIKTVEIDGVTFIHLP